MQRAPDARRPRIRPASAAGAAIACALALASCWNTPEASSQHGTLGPVPAPADHSKRMDRYSLDHCAVCATRLGTRGESIDLDHQGRQLRVCTQDCASAFAQDPRAAAAQLDARMIADQKPWYPTDRCIVTDKPLGTGAIDVVWGNRLFRVADARAERALLADPITALNRLDRLVIQAQSPTYGMPDKCPVQGDILSSDTPIDIVVANRMVRVCCMACVRAVRARPAQYLSMVEYANRQAAQRAER